MVVEHPEVVAKRAAAAEKMRRWRKANPEKNRATSREAEKLFRARHPEKMRAKRARHYAKHKESHNQKSRASYQSNRDRVLARQRQYAKDNWEKILTYHRQHKKKKRLADPQFRIQHVLRSRLNNAVKGLYKTGSAVRDLGCTVAELRAKLESQWQSGWSWENYGTVWVIDHFFPLAWANLEDRTETIAAGNHRNLRALSKQENEEKSDSLCAQAQHLFNTLKQELGVAA